MTGPSGTHGVLVGRGDGKPQQTWKFALEPLGPGARCVVSMPAGAQVVSVGAQGNLFCLWAVVAPGEPVQERYFYVAGTGHPISPDAHICLGRITVGPYEFHVFEGFK